MPDAPHHDLEPDAFASSLDDMLERVSSSTRAEQQALDEQRPEAARRESGPEVEPPAPASSPRPAPPVPPASATATPLRSGGTLSARSRTLACGVAVLVAFGGVLAWVVVRSNEFLAPPLALETLPPTAAGPVLAAPPRPAQPVRASGPAIQAAAAPLPAIASDPDASTEALMLDQLRSGNAASGAAEASSFAITRYDSLPPASRGWNVLVPLAVEEVYALVPATSRLRELDDLRGRRINVGAPGSPRAVSAEALYRTLFRQALPPAALRAASKDIALKALLRGEGLDALLLFDGQPSAWLAALPDEQRLQLRVLRFDPDRASGRRALQGYLPARVTPPVAAERTAVPTLGQVTFLIASKEQAAAGDLVRQLCRRLPALRAGGHPKWNDIDPASPLPVRIPTSPDVAPALEACAKPRSSSSPSSGALS